MVKRPSSFPEDKASAPSAGGVGEGPPILDQNIQALLECRRKEEERRGVQDVIADRITAFAGSMTFVYVHLVIYGSWIAINVGWIPLPRFDPTFVLLAMTASVEAIFLSTFVLISQNRMSRMAQKRAELDLHISLLTEHELTRLIGLTHEIAKKLGANVPPEAEIQKLAGDLDPGAVLRKIESKANEED